MAPGNSLFAVTHFLTRVVKFYDESPHVVWSTLHQNGMKLLGTFKAFERRKKRKIINILPSCLTLKVPET